MKNGTKKEVNRKLPVLFQMEDGRPLLRPTSDLVFKYIYGRDNKQSKQALIGLLNLLLDRKEDPIVDLQYKNPFRLAEYAVQKEPILDIYVRTQKGEQIAIEMQVKTDDSFIDRAVYSHAKLMAEGLERGEKYGKLKKTITISIVAGVLFPDTDRHHCVFTYKEENEHFPLTEQSQLHFLELGKIRKRPVEEMTPVERFAAWLKFRLEEGSGDFLRELMAGEEVIGMTESLFQEANQDEILRYQQWSQEKWEHDQASRMYYARKQGLEQGSLLTKIEQVCKKLKKGKTPEIIAEELEEELELIRKICRTAEDFVPEYDRDQIYEKMKGDTV